MLDDFGNNDLGIDNKGATIRTPALSEFARSGARFTKHYSYATCSPSRAALLSGQFPSRHGFSPNGRGLSPEVVTLADALLTEGYETLHIGKWHLGHTLPQAWPDKQGFTLWYGFLNQWLLKKGYANGEFNYARPTYYQPQLSRNGASTQPHEGHLTDVLTEEAVRQIAQRSGASQPWFLNLWYAAPHTPIEPAPRYAEKYTDDKRGHFLALLNQLDDSVAKVLAAVSDSEQRDNTLVLIVSDNGGTNANINNNAPFKGTKAQYLQGAVRTPLLIRWPQRVTEGTVIDSTVTIQDIYPSLMEAIGAPSNERLDGRSFWPLLTNAASTEKMEPRELFWESFFYQQRWSFSMLDSASNLRLFNQWPLSGNHQKLYLTQIDSPEIGDETAVQQNGQTSIMYAKYKNWHRNVHTLDLDYSLKESGHGYVEGHSLQRIPGFGQYSVALGFTKSALTTEKQLILEQPDVWSIVVENGQLIVQIGTHTLRAKLKEEAKCTKLVLAANFERRINHWKGMHDRISAQLYINGEMKDQITVDGAIDDSAFEPLPTYLGRSSDGQHQFNGTLQKPIFFNKILNNHSPLSRRDVEKGFCNQGSKT